MQLLGWPMVQSAESDVMPVAETTSSPSRACCRNSASVWTRCSSGSLAMASATPAALSIALSSPSSSGSSMTCHRLPPYGKSGEIGLHSGKMSRASSKLHGNWRSPEGGSGGAGSADVGASATRP